MRSLACLLICGYLLLLSPARAASAEPLSCTVARAPWVGQLVMYTQELDVQLGADTIKLRICAPNEESLTAQQMLQQLGEAMTKLHAHAGIKLQGAHERTIVLIETAELHNLNADGLLSPDGIIYLHPKTPAWVVVHEAAHYWANYQNFADLWLIEGYAEYLTSLVMQDLGSVEVPDPPSPICDQEPLMGWDYEPPATARCGYDLGAAIFQAVEAEIGREQLRLAMERLSQQSTAATSWDLLLVLERTSGHDLTELLKRPVFSSMMYPVLEQRRQLWQKLRSASHLAGPLGVSLPAYIGDQIDAMDFTDATVTLDQALPLLNAAESVNRRCLDEQLACVQPWASLPDDPAAWPPVTEHLIQAHGLLQTYTKLRQRADELQTELPQSLVQDVAALHLAAAPRLARAENLLTTLPTLEQRCRQTETDCRSYWYNAWLAEDFDTAGASIDWLTGVMTRASLVEERCREAVLACRKVWQANLADRSEAPMRALDDLTALLERVDTLRSTCGKLGWDCRQGWHAALEAGGVSRANMFIDQAQQQVPQIEAIAQSLVPRSNDGLLSLARLSGDTPALDLTAAQQALEHGDVGQALARVQAALRSQQQAAERRTLLISLVLLGGGVVLCLVVVLLLARSIHKFRRRSAA